MNKLSATAAVLAVVFGLTACGGGGAGSAGSSGNSGASAAGASASGSGSGSGVATSVSAAAPQTVQLSGPAAEILSDESTGLHRRIAIARLSNGGYASAWLLASGTSASPDYQVCFERLDTDGGRLGANTCIQAAQAANAPVRVLARPDGGFVIVWADAQDLSARSQAFDGSGTATAAIQQGPQQPVDAAAVALAGGGYVEVSTRPGGAGTTASTISFQRYASDGTPVGGPTSVGDSGGLDAQVAALRDGGFVVAWEQGGSAPAVTTRMFTADGTPVGSPVQASGTALSCGSAGCQYQVLSALGAMDDGGYLVVWMNGSGMADIAGTFARRFEPDGSPGAAVGKLDDEGVGGAAMAASGSDGFILAWSQASGTGSSTVARVFDATPLR